MHHVEPMRTVGLRGDAQHTTLPQPVVKVNTARTLLPPSGPSRQVVVDELQLTAEGQILLSASTLDAGTVVRARKHRQMVPTTQQCQHPVPSHAWLGTFVWLARIGRQQHPQRARCRRHRSPTRDARTRCSRTNRTAWTVSRSVNSSPLSVLIRLAPGSRAATSRYDWASASQS